jgi:hypothetical protein
MLQAAERKARFTDQVMCRRADADETWHTGDAAVSYSEVRTPANGNPLLIDKARADAELARLEPPNATGATFSGDRGKVLCVVRHEHLATPIVNTVAAVPLPCIATASLARDSTGRCRGSKGG